MVECLKANVLASQVVTQALVDRVSELVVDEDSPIVRNMEGSMLFNVMTKPEHIEPSVVQRIRYILPWFGK